MPARSILWRDSISERIISYRFEIVYFEIAPDPCLVAALLESWRVFLRGPTELEKAVFMWLAW